MSDYNLGDSNHPWAITEEEMKRFKGFEDMSEEQSKLVKETLVRLAVIAMEIN